jgi:hypothetical protein
MRNPNRRCALPLRFQSLVFGCRVHAVDDDHGHTVSRRFELEPELFVERGHEDEPSGCGMFAAAAGTLAPIRLASASTGALIYDERG